ALTVAEKEAGALFATRIEAILDRPADPCPGKIPYNFATFAPGAEITELPKHARDLNPYQVLRVSVPDTWANLSNEERNELWERARQNRTAMLAKLAEKPHA